MLQMHPEFRGAAIVRTRNPEELAKCDIVIDVGAIYDHSSRRYDHHQRTFSDVLGEVEGAKRAFNTKLSACGLVYKHYGRDLITALYPDHADQAGIFYPKLYSGFVEHIDAIDNGIPVASGDLNYSVSSTLSSRVGALNPPWNKATSREESNARFRLAMLVTGRELLLRLHDMATSWWPARALVQQAVAARKEVHPSGKVMLLKQYCPWQGHVYEVEEAAGAGGELEYALYSDTSGNWRIQAVAAAPGSFDSRKKLPEPWRGVRDEELSKLTGVEGCIFVHAAGFIGGTKTKEGILQLASMAAEWGSDAEQQEGGSKPAEE